MADINISEIYLSCRICELSLYNIQHMHIKHSGTEKSTIQKVKDFNVWHGVKDSHNYIRKSQVCPRKKSKISTKIPKLFQ